MTMANELRFRRLRLRNWKNFRDVDVEVPDRMFLVGANGCLRRLVVGQRAGAVR